MSDYLLCTALLLGPPLFTMLGFYLGATRKATLARKKFPTGNLDLTSIIIDRLNKK